MQEWIKITEDIRLPEHNHIWVATKCGMVTHGMLYQGKFEIGYGEEVEVSEITHFMRYQTPLHPERG